MRRNVALLACLAVLSLVGMSGCNFAGMPWAYGPSGVASAPLFTSVTYPAENTAYSRFEFTPADVEIVGPVSGKASSSSIIFGLIATGDSGYEKALKDARERGVEDIVNVRVDMSYFNLLGLFSTVTTTVSGTGIRWKR